MIEVIAELARRAGALLAVAGFIAWWLCIGYIAIHFIVKFW